MPKHFEPFSQWDRLLCVFIVWWNSANSYLKQRFVDPWTITNYLRYELTALLFVSISYKTQRDKRFSTLERMAASRQKWAGSWYLHIKAHNTSNNAHVLYEYFMFIYNLERRSMNYKQMIPLGR